MINHQDFLDKYYPNANSVFQKDVKRFFDNLNKIIGSTPLPEALQDQQLLCRLFYIQKTGGISSSHYQKIKGYLLNLFKEYNISGEVPTRDAVIKSQQSLGYFSSIDELLAFIDEVGEMRFEYYNPTQDLVMVKAICVLGWLGFSPNEIAEMKKSDLTLIGYDTYKIYHGDDEYEISGAPFAALFYLSNLTSYSSLPRGKKMILSGDPDFLFRPVINSEKLVGDSIIQIIRRFNNQIPITSDHRAITFRNLYKNALFVEIYNDQTDRKLLEKIAAIMKCDKHYALSYREQYLHFVAALESKKI